MVVADHDLTFLDFVSDSICILYGFPGIYGVVTEPFTVNEGINNFLSGFIPTENLWFWDEGHTFGIAGDLKNDKN